MMSTWYVNIMNVMCKINHRLNIYIYVNILDASMIFNDISCPTAGPKATPRRAEPKVPSKLWPHPAFQVHRGINMFQKQLEI